jgi:hypothetical protein
MAKMYQYYEIDGLPDLKVGERLETLTQFGMPGVTVDKAHTAITYLGKSDHPSFSKYFVEHDTVRNLIWRNYTGELIRGGLIEVLEFHMYRHVGQGYYYIDSSHQHIQEMCKRLLSKIPELSMRIRNVDLPSTKEEFKSRVSIGYFGSLNIEQVSACAIYGPDVGESQMWEYLMEHGQLNAMTLEFKYFNEMQKVMVHRLGGIMPYHSFGENATLDIVDEVKRLIEPLSTVNEISLRRRRK